jgi:hypothetical protein
MTLPMFSNLDSFVKGSQPESIPVQGPDILEWIGLRALMDRGARHWSKGLTDTTNNLT